MKCNDVHDDCVVLNRHLALKLQIMSYLAHALQDKRILVTGATGFIGSRLSWRLAAEEEAIVTGSGRRLDRVNHLKGAGVNLKHVDLLDDSGMELLVAGQEVVIHLAWLGRDRGAVGETHLLNVTSTENLMRAAAAAGVRRFIFASSVNAYGPPVRDIVDESHPVNPEQRDAYGRSKAIAETRVTQLAKEMDMELVIIRPAMVYGPASRTWTMRMLALMQRGVPVIFGDGAGYAFPIYIDNLIDGILLATARSGIGGEVFNFSDPPLTWREFFGYYGAMCGRNPRSLPLWAARILALISETLNLGLPLTRERLAFYVHQHVFPMVRAETMLGYEARVPIAEGMKLTESWLRDAGYLETGSRA